MPQQEVFFEQNRGGRLIKVLKTYDQSYAREAFDSMDEAAQAHLWKTLDIDSIYDPTDTPESSDPDSEDFLWDELLESAREDGHLLSFFVVSEAVANSPANLYVSPDWPSAEAFAKERLNRLQ